MRKTRLLALLCATLVMLSACIGESKSDSSGGETVGVTALPTALTEEELRDFEALFIAAEGETRPMTAMLLCCDYACAEEADFGLIFREGIPDGEGGWGYNVDQEELDALAVALGVGEDDFIYWGDTYRMPRTEMEALTQRYFGISLEAGSGLDQLTYLAQYDAYFSTVTDTMIWQPDFTSGIRDGDAVRLRYAGFLDEEKELTLRWEGERWIFCSNLPAAD